MTKQTATARARISAEQRAALDRIADERDVPIANVLANAVAAVTGVPDTLRRHGVRRKTSSTRGAAF